MLPVAALMLLLSTGTPEIKIESSVKVMKKGEATKDLILKLRPGLDRRRAWHLGWLLEHYAEKYGLDPTLMAVIVRQESNFDSGLRACWLQAAKVGDPPTKTEPETPGATCDYGLAQINQLWIKTWDLDPDKLQNDDSYNISIMARILKQLQVQWEESEAKWWGRYNSSAPIHRARYEAHLDRHFAVLN